LAKIPVGEGFSRGGQSVAAMVFRTGRAARIVSYENASGNIAGRFRDLGMRTAVGAHAGETLPPIRLRRQPSLNTNRR
jgi:hypothetical protein